MNRTPLILLGVVLVANCGSGKRTYQSGTDRRGMPVEAGHIQVVDNTHVSDFSDYPAKVFVGPLVFPKEDDWPNPNWSEDSAQGITFGGHFTYVIIKCGTGCTSDRLVDRKTGQMIRAPEGEDDVRSVSIDTQADSNLMKVMWVSSRNDGTGTVFPPCFKQNFVWTGSTFRALTKRIQAECPAEVTQ